MGSNPKESVLNRYLQHWDVPNLFVMGSSAFPQNPGYNPTGTVAAVLYAVGCVNPRDCQAVGGTMQGNGRVFGERWSGSRWRAERMPSPPAAENSSLVGVACVSAADCWGAGSYYNGSADRSLIEHWNGTAWTIVT